MLKREEGITSKATSDTRVGGSGVRGASDIRD